MSRRFSGTSAGERSPWVGPRYLLAPHRTSNNVCLHLEPTSLKAPLPQSSFLLAADSICCISVYV
ncbi:hypothetical protein SO694_0002132 [Aureococcus anophagefferens]|uniref:Uncharacterized protein n=1 Tax=Aureococcus anophagefferens TaxID=44056 RepID=A0ABR1FU46_AURAN